MRRRYGWALVYALGGIGIVLIIVGIGKIGDLVQAIRDGQTSRAPLLQSTDAAAHAASRGTNRIENCTTPGRRCFERSQRNLATVVAGLNQGSQKAASAAAACAATLPDPSYQAVYRCVVHTLGENQ